MALQSALKRISAFPPFERTACILGSMILQKLQHRRKVPSITFCQRSGSGRFANSPSKHEEPARPSGVFRAAEGGGARRGDTWRDSHHESDRENVRRASQLVGGKRRGRGWTVLKNSLMDTKRRHCSLRQFLYNHLQEDASDNGLGKIWGLLSRKYKWSFLLLQSQRLKYRSRHSPTAPEREIPVVQ